MQNDANWNCLSLSSTIASYPKTAGESTRGGLIYGEPASLAEISSRPRRPGWRVAAFPNLRGFIRKSVRRDVTVFRGQETATVPLRQTEQVYYERACFFAVIMYDLMQNFTKKRFKTIDIFIILDSTLYFSHLYLQLS